MHKPQEILEKNGLKKTASRIDIVRLFMDNDFAISQSFLEHNLIQLDRVTIYRTLNTFESKGLIHRIIGPNNEVKYAYCSDHCHEGTHDDNHLHFTCLACEKTYCMEQESPKIELPSGYVINQSSILIEGTCEYCSEK